MRRIDQEFLRLPGCCIALVLAASVVLPADAGQEPGRRSVHRAQIDELGRSAHPPTDDDPAATALAVSQAAAAAITPVVAPRTGPNAIDDDFVVFGYLQSETQVYHLRWHALTHVGSRFVGFNSAGHLTGTSAFTGRSSYLKSGGAAQAAGVKVVLVLASFSDGSGGTIETVMTSPARRATLVGELVQLLAADEYSHGVSLDLEFSWGPNVRDGITAFTHDLRAGLNSLGPEYELSIYTNAIFSSNQWDFDAATGITPAIDYMLYSMYDWASGNTAHAISDFDNGLGSSRMYAYLNDGLPPEKLVPVISAYSRRWSGTSVYNGFGTSPSSAGFTDALYDVTLNPAIGPSALHYVRADEAGWYGWNSGTARVRTFDGLESMEYKIRHALSAQDPSGTWSGRRLGGVGFWSLMWMAEFNSIDPRTGGSVARTRTYPHIYRLCHETFSSAGSPAGTRRFLLETFAGLDFRWRDPGDSPDTVGDIDGDSFRTLAPSPVARGNALRITYDFEGATGNRAVVAHEVLASPIAPSIPDTNAVLGYMPRTSRVSAPVYTILAQPGYGVRMIVIDGLGQLESSPAISLDGTGWQTISWDLSDAQATTAFLTSEPAFTTGNGVVDSAGSAVDDVAFYGFVIEGGGAAHGTLLIDEVTYESVDPDGNDYRINEFRYSDSASEFVEIHGPAGPLPIGLTVQVYDASDGSVRKTIPLFGTIPNDGGGYGFFVAGDPGVPGVDSSAAFSVVTDDISNLDPSALQLRDTWTGHVYDSLVYEAYGGLDELIRRETHGVTANGWPWMGDVANGRDAAGQRYTIGRYPDGYDTGRNREDFSFAMASPGAPNGDVLALPVSFEFESSFPAGFQTYDVLRRTTPTSAGLPASPNGGRAWRCVDAVGGGVIGAIGVAALGRMQGHSVAGEIFVPATFAPAQATAVGVCGSQGSNFFSSTAAARTAYESGYWLIHENRAGVQLADGRPDHPRVWELVHATHDNMDGERVTLLASISDATLGIVGGTWTSFEFIVQPYDRSGDRLVVSLGGQEIYRGPLPEDGPRKGAFQVGFRENHSGPPAPSEGTWVDDLEFSHVGPVGEPD